MLTNGLKVDMNHEREFSLLRCSKKSPWSSSVLKGVRQLTVPTTRIRRVVGSICFNLRLISSDGAPGKTGHDMP